MKASILVVDGDPDICRVIEAILAREGLCITCAGSGEEALKRLQWKSFDVVIMDMRIPDIPGVAFLKRIRKEEDDVEIIVLSGFLTFEQVIGAMRDGGAADYLMKPLAHADVLVDAVKRALKKRTSRKEKRALAEALKRRNRGLEVEIDHLRRCMGYWMAPTEMKHREGG